MLWVKGELWTLLPAGVSHTVKKKEHGFKRNVTKQSRVSCPWTGFLKQGCPWAEGRSWRALRSNASGLTKPWTPGKKKTNQRQQTLNDIDQKQKSRTLLQIWTHFYPFDAGLHPQLLHRPPGLSRSAGALHSGWHLSLSGSSAQICRRKKSTLWMKFYLS